MRYLRDPLLHFVILGAALFAVHAWTTAAVSSRQTRRIEITPAQIELLNSGFERQWGRGPTAQEREKLIEARIREEVLYREALAVGLDRNDVVVRRRMVQKMELLTQDIALLADPTDEELRSYFEEHGDEYRIPPRVSFSHVYFNADVRGAAVEEDAGRALAELRAKSPAIDRAPELGDSIMLEYDYGLATPDEVRRVFGDRFAEELFALEPGWQGPVRSGYGLHLVHVGQRVQGRSREYDEIRDRLAADYDRLRRERAKAALYENLVQRYELVVDSEPRP